MLKRATKAAFRAAGLTINRIPAPQPAKQPFNLRDSGLYAPYFTPSLSPESRATYELIKPYTVVLPESVCVLSSLAAQARRLGGEFWECGVYRGGTAMLLAEVVRGANRTLRLFDTFEGMPATDPGKDWHKAGDFADTSIEAVKDRVNDPFVHFHKGLMPATFQGLEGRQIAFAHIDVDIYSSVQACCEFIFPRLQSGGFMIFDDYGFPTCPGARQAVDEFFADTDCVPLILSTGQAIVFRSPSVSA
jgi:O-methyltransferase